MSNLLNPNAVGTVNDFLENAPVEEVPTEEVSEETPEVEEPMDPIDALGIDFPDAPGRDLIEQWKAGFGAVHAFVPNQKEAYLFRPLRRMEYTRIAQDMARLRESAAAQDDPTIIENQTHERVVSACVLYPRDLVSPEKLNFSPAGLFQTLFELIMRNSHFVSPEAALQACYRL